MLRAKDGRHIAVGAASSSIGPQGDANPDRRSRERESAHALQFLGTTKGPRKMVREVPDQNGYEANRSLVLRYGSRDAHGETTLLIKVKNFNFGDIDVMESKFEEFNLLIKEHDDIPAKDNVLDTTKRAILVGRAPAPLRTHLELNSQSYSTFLEMRQAINQYLKARKGFKLKEREDDPMDVDFVNKESLKDKEKGNDKGRGKSKGKSKGKGKHNEKGKCSGKGRSSQETFRGTLQKLARQDTNGANVVRGGGAAKQVNSVGERRRKLVT